MIENPESYRFNIEPQPVKNSMNHTQALNWSPSKDKSMRDKEYRLKSQVRDAPSPYENRMQDRIANQMLEMSMQRSRPQEKLYPTYSKSKSPSYAP
jgi:hypothetical protein